MFGQLIKCLFEPLLQRGGALCPRFVPRPYSVFNRLAGFSSVCVQRNDFRVFITPRMINYYYYCRRRFARRQCVCCERRQRSATISIFFFFFSFSAKRAAALAATKQDKWSLISTVYYNIRHDVCPLSPV